MKQILLATALMAFIGNPAEAKTKKKGCKSTCSNPAHHHDASDRTRTDHSYDRAYSAQWSGMAKQPGAPVSGTAVSSGYVQNTGSTYTQPPVIYYNTAVSAAADQGLNTQNDKSIALPGVTVREDADLGYQRPSPYLGDVSPSNDGPAKNEYRNINVGNTSQRLPSNDGSTK